MRTIKLNDKIFMLDEETNLSVRETEEGMCGYVTHCGYMALVAKHIPYANYIVRVRTHTILPISTINPLGTAYYILRLNNVSHHMNCNPLQSAGTKWLEIPKRQCVTLAVERLLKLHALID